LGGETVLDVGSGTGEFSYLLANAGAASVTGIDFAENAVNEANRRYQHPHLRFETKNLFDMEGKFDVIVSLGTLEHMDDPLEGLQKMKSLLNDKGSIIVTVPNWLNPRGYVLLTLLFLFDAKITLADLHYLSPAHFEKWAKELDMRLTWQTVNHSWGSGETGIADLRDRLPKVAQSSNLAISEEGIRDLSDWLEQNAIGFYEEPGLITGAIGVFHLQKKS